MQNSKIEWTDHTFNPWWGCQRVSPGCEHCYAETLANRYGHAVWGPAKTTTRRMMSDNYWKQPIKWNRDAEQAGTRARVFCASMADVFEDHPQLIEPRRRLFNLIFSTPHLDWQLLTKRPENIKPLTRQITDSRGQYNVWDHVWPRYLSNIWIGTSCEDQKRADERIPHLLNTPARVLFLSCEPLLGPIDLSHFANSAGEAYGLHEGLIDWIIAGGESGPGARPMHPDWVRSLRDQAKAADVAFLFKQWGEYGPPQHATPGGKVSLFCAGGTARTVEIVKLGKHAAGRLLDGVEHSEFPL